MFSIIIHNFNLNTLKLLKMMRTDFEKKFNNMIVFRFGD